eukprot:6208592-Pleurochrysis_carterae.AAC.1
MSGVFSHAGTFLPMRVPQMFVFARMRIALLSPFWTYIVFYLLLVRWQPLSSLRISLSSADAYRVSAFVQVFQSLDGETRIFVMPFCDEPQTSMWQVAERQEERDGRHSLFLATHTKHALLEAALLRGCNASLYLPGPV